MSMRFADLFFFPSSRLLCGLIALMGLLVASPARAQSPVDLAAAEQYTASLDHNFWEQAWVRHLDANTGSDGRIDWTYGDRQTLGALTDDYQRAIEAADGFWTHLQVQDYLQRRLLTVQPNPMMAGRPGAFRLRLLRTTTPNALALNDGTILITTGLLTTLKTEAQLHAVLAHEVAHIVLDHALDGYRSNKKRSKARKVLGTIVGGVTSVVTPGFGGRGSLESTAYGLSSDLATQYLDREFIASAGLEYSRSQEEEAIRLAQQWLMAHDAPPAALYTALQALQRDSRGRSASHGAAFMDSHPGTSDRRATLASIIEAEGGNPSALDDASVPVDASYDTAIAAVLEHEAEMDLAARRFYAAHEALDRALRTDWTTPRTFLFKAIAVRNTTTTAAGRREALDLLDAAERAAEAPEPRIEAERALWRVRQGRPDAARRHLTRCRRQIDDLRSTMAPEDAPSTMHDSLYAWASTLEARLRE
jgi:Zn-dependent protease with chaperone function